MRASFLFFSLSFACGVASLWFMPSLPLWSWGRVAAFFCLGIAWILRDKPLIFLVCFSYAAGFFWCFHAASEVMAQRLPVVLEGVPLQVRGEIVGLPEGESQNLRFDFQLMTIENSAASNWHLPQTIRLSWYQQKGNFAVTPHVGETWCLTVKLKTPRSTFNPDSFDYEAWLFSHRFSATGYVVEGPTNKKVALSFWRNPIRVWREKIQQDMEENFSGNKNLGVMEALSIGVRDQLSPQDWQAMQATGTNHLVAIAGLHVGFLVGFVIAITQFLWRRCSWLMLFLPAQEAAIICALFAALYYSVLAGFSLPTQRACVMLVVGLCSTLLRRVVSPWQSLLLALFAVLLYDPLSVFSESFWLSFTAVFVILFCVVGRKMSYSKIRQSIWIQWVIALGLAPLTLYFFHQISFINLLANGLAIPWVAFIILPLMLLGVLLLPLSLSCAYFFWYLASQALSPFWPTLFFLASVDRLQWHTVVPSIMILIVMTLGTMWLLAPRGIPYRYLGLFGFVPLFFPPIVSVPQGAVRLTQLDVGQGLSTLIQTAHHALLFDTGIRLDEHFDMGQSVVVPALYGRHISMLDMMVISHADNDHSGGSFAVLQAFPIKQILTSAPGLYASVPGILPQHLVTISSWLQQHWLKPQVVSCVTGQHWVWDGVSFDVLNPNSNYAPKKTNDRCCVVRVSTGGHRVLLTGDIEKTTEKHLLQAFSPSELHADVLVAPHHGSKSSSSEVFLQAVRPVWVIYATGYRNRFHFPNAEIVARYQQLGTKSVDTASDGQIIFDIPSDAGAIGVQRTRQESRHFWRY